MEGIGGVTLVGYMLSILEALDLISSTKEQVTVTVLFQFVP